MTKAAPRCRCRGRQRRGNIIVLTAVLITGLLALGAMSINLTQIATTKTELRLASDAAAKAGSITLGQTQNVGAARRAAKQIAAKHRVNGKSMKIHNVDVDFGFSRQQDDGSYSFQENVRPFNSVRVNARIGEDTRYGEGEYYMKGILDPGNFSLHYESTAARVDHDLCLVVDRSGSMAWDMSNEEWSYPPQEDDGNTENDTESIMQRYFEPPHPALSRWAALTRSTDMFFDHLDTLDVEVQSGLVSYSSNFVFGIYTSEASTTHSELTLDHTSLQPPLEELGEEPLIGNTNIASGMQAAYDVLTGPGSRLTAKGTMVVLTDGINNQGTDPVEVARAAAAANITVHAITFSEQADTELMTRVAAAGGGNLFDAPDEASLQEAFRRIADTLPSVLTQ